MDQFVEFLDTYHGRNVVIRFCGYFTQFIAGCSPEPYSRKLLVVSNQLSSCRIILRLFDDLPMLQYCRQYGLGKEDESDVEIRLFSILTNIFDMLYYPVEHIAWAEDIGLIPRSKLMNWWTVSSVFWALSSYFTLSRALKRAKNINSQKSKLKMYGSEIQMLGPRYKEYISLSSLQFMEIISAIRSLADLIEAIHYLPDGFLWAGNLKEWQLGGLGTISCLISFYESYKSLK